MPEPTYCDFCRASGVALDRKFQAVDRIVADMADGTTFLDSGDWLACAECAALIDIADWATLVERALDGTMAAGNLISQYKALPGREELRERCREVFRSVFGPKFTL